ncbi:MAG TPA: DUF308 domain-containing protein [Gemmatimonadales bacterium]|nr:DUF308 domain-containing protein [Gemmatimonadales bacterium]
MTGAVRDELHRATQRAWWSLLLRGLLALAVGIFIFLRPLDSIAAFALVIAFWALFAGFVYIAQAFELKPILKHWWLLLISGIVSTGFGVASLIYYPVLSLTFAIVWVAWWLMLSGILELYGAVLLKKMGTSWGWPAAFGVLSVAAAAFALLIPPATLAAIMGLIAGFAIVAGVALLAGAFRLRALLRA